MGWAAQQLVAPDRLIENLAASHFVFERINSSVVVLRNPAAGELGPLGLHWIVQ